MKRRTFIRNSTAGSLAMAMPVIPDFLSSAPELRFGVAEAGYHKRWYRKMESSVYPPFNNAVDMIAHCDSLGFGGVQVNVRDWDKEMVQKIRKIQDERNFYVEGQIRMPKDKPDLQRFEAEIKSAKEAGVEIFRAVSLSGRRYENFESKNAFEEFKEASISAIKQAEPIMRKHRVKLAMENHKDWRADEFLQILKIVDSEWVGVTLDTGNNIALLEDPMEVVDTLAPYAFSVHLKDMGVEEYEDGFLLSEVNLGEGYLDIEGMIGRIRKHNEGIRFNLEMMTRDPLEIPCLTTKYWATFDEVPATELATCLHMIRKHQSNTPLARISAQPADVQLALEVENNRTSLIHAKENYGFS
jgi:sugar phosphate isomerase/epimerase